MKDLTKDECKWSRRATVLAFILILGSVYCPWWASREETMFGTRDVVLCPWGVVIRMGDLWAYQILSYRGGTNYAVPSVGIVIDAMLAPYVVTNALAVSFAVFVILVFSLILLAVGNRKKSIAIVGIVIPLLISTPIVFLACWPAGSKTGYFSVGFYLSFASALSTVPSLLHVRRRVERESAQLKSRKEAIILADTGGVSIPFAEAVSSFSMNDLQDNLTVYRRQLKNLDLSFSRKEITEAVHTSRKLEIEAKIKLLERTLERKSEDFRKMFAKKSKD